MIKINALIVEDEPLVAIFIKRVLLKYGIHVIDTIYDCEKALHAIHAHQPDVIFMDINIKGALDGISVIRKVTLPKKTSLFYITAYNSLEIIEEAMQTKPTSYLIKPIKEEDIVIALGIVKNSMDTYLSQQKHESKRMISLGNSLSYDLKSRRLVCDTQKITFTHTESKIVDLLVANMNQKVAYEEINEVVWEGKEIALSTLRDALCSIRQKVPALNIVNCYGEGYKLITE